MQGVTENKNIQWDVLVVGAGIAGLQAALEVADQGRKVLLVEKQPSIGGRMINLSKVFPTLDCASCITTPRMASVAHHLNITIRTYSELKGIQREGDFFKTVLVQKARYVNEEACIGCRRCEEVCPVLVPDEYEHGLGARKAIRIPFTNAIPQLAVLDMDHCILCGACAKACPTDCIDFLQEDKKMPVEVGAVILATGHQLTPMNAKSQYGGAKLSNVISPMQAERLLAPHGPYGRVLRPSDGKVPESIAYVQCAGSRDASLGVSYCSRVCCMYAIKQAMLLSGSLPVAEITIYYMDIRAFGKGYEQFVTHAAAMGIHFVKAKVAKITEDEEHNPVVRIERQEGGAIPETVKHDLVVLSLGMIPGADPQLEDFSGVSCAADGFIENPHSKLAPTQTTSSGVFAAGTAIGPKDIVDSIVDAGSAALEALQYLRQQGR
jgi:heterodisulfide reductase subunit A